MEKNMHVNFHTIDGKPIRCKMCNGKMKYLSGGKYQCELCEAFDYDDFGKVKNFLEEFGPASTSVISKVTGVPEQVISDFLKEGRIQVVDTGKSYLKCENCGTPIRFGRFCQKCTVSMVTDIENSLNEDLQKRRKERGMDGKMRFSNKKI